MRYIVMIAVAFNFVIAMPALATEVSTAPEAALDQAMAKKADEKKEAAKDTKKKKKHKKSSKKKKDS